MSAMEHPDQIRTMRQVVEAQEVEREVSSFTARWAALHEYSLEIGRFAALADEPFDGQLASFPRRISDAGGAAHQLAQRGLDDIDAIMQPGLAALRAIHARGQEPTAPALALWREFHAARQSLLSLCP